jgi:5-methylcytosine-specific restriction protein A
MPRALHPCAGCGTPIRGRCPHCRQATDARRGTAEQRGYDREHRERFRKGVLAKHPTCQCDRPHEHRHGATCTRPSRHADHHPKDRRELVRLGLDPNDPAHGRGLCGPCHSGHTAHHQPGGWHQPTAQPR